VKIYRKDSGGGGFMFYSHCTLSLVWDWWAYVVDCRPWPRILQFKYSSKS